MRNSGQSLFELVVAIGIVGLILLTLVSLATLSVRNASQSRNDAEAARLGQEMIEWLRHERDTNWTLFVTQSTTIPKRCAPGQAGSSYQWTDTHAGGCNQSSSTDRISNLYFRELNFCPTEINECVNDLSFSDTNTDGFVDRVPVVVKVYWTDAQGYHEVKNTTYFTDWKIQ